MMPVLEGSGRRQNRRIEPAAGETEALTGGCRPEPIRLPVRLLRLAQAHPGGPRDRRRRARRADRGRSTTSPTAPTARRASRASYVTTASAAAEIGSLESCVTGAWPDGAGGGGASPRRRSGTGICGGPQRQYRSGGELGPGVCSQSLLDRVRHNLRVVASAVRFSKNGRLGRSSGLLSAHGRRLVSWLQRTCGRYSHGPSGEM